MTYNCSHGDYPGHSKSKLITIGNTLITDWGSVRVIKVYDSGSGMLGIKPIGWSEVPVVTVDGQHETIGNMIVTANFTTLGGAGASIQVCVEVEEEPPVDKCVDVICENVCTDKGHLIIKECDPFLGVCQSVETVLNAPECISVQLKGKEFVFPFSKDISTFWDNAKIREYITKIVKLLGGKSAYLEDGTKIVVVL